jgi:putative glutamine amidotransferase
MQMMALVAGGKLDQHLPESMPTADRHWNNSGHTVKAVGGPSIAGKWCEGSALTVTSHHRQAVRDAGALRVGAVSDDGVIEAIENPRAKFFVGVQWHPERTADRALGVGVFESLVRAARKA